MSDDYTPAVGLVRSAYVQAGMPTSEFYEATRNQMRQAEFDRFIAQVKAEALEEAAAATTTPRQGIPYEVWAWCSDWLRARATEYRSGSRT